MEFLAGIIFTLFIGFIGYKIDQANKRKKTREAYIPPAGSGLDRPLKKRDNLD